VADDDADELDSAAVAAFFAQVIKKIDDIGLVLFNVYGDAHQKLLARGVNVQDRLIALHDLDCPWRPRDLEQRSGRIVRQGNKNNEGHIFRYVTENTFDAYLYQILKNKQHFISQIMTSKSPVRSAKDIDETALSYAEESKFAGMMIKDIAYAEKAKAGAAILEAGKAMTSPEPRELGSYLGFPMLFSFNGFSKQYQITLWGALSHTMALGADVHGNITNYMEVLL
jgi:hypothetical protein